MEKISKIGTVVKFEIVRNLKKPSFWVAAILLPVLMVGYMFFAGMTGAGIGETLSEGTNMDDMELGLLDETGMVESDRFVVVESKEQGVEDVKSGTLDVFYFIPGNFVEDSVVRIFAKTDRTDLFANYEEPIRTALAESAANRIAPEDMLAIMGSFTVDTTSFTADGEVDNIIGRMAIPIVALALFYVLIVMFGNRLTMATVEEKENRITEMLFTSLTPTTLVLGKIISLIVLGVVQLVVLMLPLLIFYMYGNTQGMLPFELNVDWNFWSVATSLLLLVLAYFLFTGLAVAIGALVPTAKELAPYASVFMILVILPIFSMQSFIVAEPTVLTYILTYFPFSAPVSLLLRNAFGTLPAWEMAIGVGVIAVSSVVAVWLAVYIFKRSAMDFTSKISLRALFAKGTRSKW